MGLSVDEFLEKIGSFGPYQWRLLLIMSYMKIFGDGFQALVMSFMAAEPPWRCAGNSTVCNISGSISPGDAQYKLRCDIPRNAWEFDTSEFNSIVTEWDLVCDKSSLASLSKSIVFAGYLVGVLFGGILSDKFGRKAIVYYPSVICNILALIVSFVDIFWVFMLLRGLIGVCIGSSSLATFILLTEYAGVKHRAVAGTSLWYSFTLSLMLLPLFGYLIRDWRNFSIATSAPGLLQIFFWWWLPESTRWLVVQRKPTQAMETLKIVARMNKKEMPQEGVECVEEKQRTGDVRDLFGSWRVCHRTLVCWFSWMVISLIYYGVTFSAGSFGGNRYLVFFLVSIIELPSHWATIKSMDRFGRRKSMIFTLIVASISSTGAVLLQRDLSDKGFLAGRIIMSMTAKFFISMAYDVVYVYSAELFPTVVRNLAMGTCSAFARVGSISAPFVIWLVRIHVLLPYSIMAACAGLAAILCLTVPETKGAPTPEVFEKDKKPVGGDREDIQSVETYL